MDGGVTDANTPNLCVRTTGQQSICGGEGIVRHFKFAAVDVDGNNLAVIADFHLRPHSLLVHFFAAPGMFLFTVSRFPHGHVNSPPNPSPFGEDRDSMDVNKLL